MPRGKKTDSISKKSKKTEVDEIEESEEKIEEEEEEEEEEEVEQKKSSKNSSKNSSKKSSKKLSKKSKEKINDEDELSDLDVDDGEQDEVISTKSVTSHQSEIKIIDPKSRLCDLKPDAILTHLIKVGTDELNPQLKIGALNLLRQLTGRRRKHPPMYGGSKSNNYYNQNFRPFDPQGRGRGRGRGRGNDQMYSNGRSNQSKQISGDIYNDE